MLRSTPPTRPKTALLLTGVLTLLAACAPRQAPTSSSLTPNLAAQTDTPLASPELEPSDARITPSVDELPQSTAAATSPPSTGEGDRRKRDAAATALATHRLPESGALGTTDTTGRPDALSTAPSAAQATDVPTAAPPPTDAAQLAELPAALAAIAASPTWLNTAPFPPEALRGRVVIVEFWTYG